MAYGNQIAAKRVVNATASVSTVDLIFLSDAAQKVTVANTTGTAPIFFTVSHPGGDGNVPTVGGQGCYQLPAAISSLDVRHDGQFGTIVQLISSGTPSYSVAITQ
jgi:hypothetical protein